MNDIDPKGSSATPRCTCLPIRSALDGQVKHVKSCAMSREPRGPRIDLRNREKSFGQAMEEADRAG